MNTKTAFRRPRRSMLGATEVNYVFDNISAWAPALQRANDFSLIKRRDPKSDLRRRLLTCTALVAVCTWAPLNAASAQVNVVADGTSVDL